MNAVDGNRYKCHTNNNPSFSSTLLDIIYRSIDEKDNEKEPVMYRKPLVRRNDSNQVNYNSDIDSGYRSRLRSTECTPKPRPIRTRNNHVEDDNERKPDSDSNFTKTKKTKTMMKLYSYLNKGKQPISPGGGRLTAFLISLFASNNTKKSVVSSPCNGGDHDAIIHTNTKSKSKTKMTKNYNTNTTCSNSSVSSVSRGKLNSTVRFYPTSVFIDESTHGKGEIEKTRKNLLRNYQKNVTKDDNDDGNDEDEDDDVSCVSSDLFELDHLTAMQELPLYETTSIDVNRAIANGLVL